MRYFSTKDRNHSTSFREAALTGQPADRGLYFPETIPILSKGFLSSLAGLSEMEIAIEVMKPYTKDDMSTAELSDILSYLEKIKFPLQPVTENISALELYHGPTLAFKDVGAGFMSRCFHYFMKSSDQPGTVLVATSGDTGGAVAQAFADTGDVPVVILYPSRKVSSVQEYQLTAMGSPIHALEVDGSFDDCQRMVKTAFADPLLRNKLMLTSANSINIARWLPQQLYYFFAYRQWTYENGLVISVPSGNFGNLSAGLLAFQSGLPVKHFIAACNINDTVPDFFESGSYRAKPSRSTISNAMDVGDPSNVPRMLELFDGNLNALKKMVSTAVISDDETRKTLRVLYENYNYLADPHGAVGFAALNSFLQQHPEEKGLFLETAHPVKFPESVEAITHQPIPIPASLQKLMTAKKSSIRMPASDEALRDFLLNTLT